MHIAYIGQKGISRSERSGGIETRVFEVATRLQSRGHQVSVYARRKRSQGTPTFVNGVRIYYIPTIYTKHLEAIVHTFLSSMHAVVKGYDVYHYHGVGPSTLAWIPRFFRPKAKVVVTFHAQDKNQKKWGWLARQFLSFGERTALRFPHATICVSHALQVFAQERFRKVCVFIPNGAEAKDALERSALLAFHLEPKKYLLAVGRLTSAKELPLLIKAFGDVETNMRLVIVGDGEDRSKIEELARGNDRIILTGFQSQDVLNQLYANAYAFVQASSSEGLPLSVLEAMSFGLLPIVSDIPGHQEAIHGAGETFPVGSREALAIKLRELILRPDLVSQKGEDAAAIIETAFNWDSIAENVEDVYLSL
jgi:glycosyltransferase involved in cell wall biosynthesis